MSDESRSVTCAFCPQVFAACTICIEINANCAGDDTVVKRAMRGARAVICPGKLGAVLGVAAQQKVEHIVLLSSAGRCCHCCY